MYTCICICMYTGVSGVAGGLDELLYDAAKGRRRRNMGAPDLSPRIVATWWFPVDWCF